MSGSQPIGGIGQDAINCFNPALLPLYQRMIFGKATVQKAPLLGNVPLSIGLELFASQIHDATFAGFFTNGRSFSSAMGLARIRTA